MNDSIPTTVADNVVVSLDYTLLVDGESVDSTAERDPLEYIQGQRNLIPGLENALAGMQAGETREVRVPPSEAYGDVDPDAFADVPRDQFPPEFELTIGRGLRVRSGDGRVLNARVCEIGEETVTLDLNHPMAGKELFFQARIVALRAATPEEVESGRVGGGCSCGSGGCGSEGCGSSGCC